MSTLDRRLLGVLLFLSLAAFLAPFYLPFRPIGVLRDLFNARDGLRLCGFITVWFAAGTWAIAVCYLLGGRHGQAWSAASTALLFALVIDLAVLMVLGPSGERYGGSPASIPSSVGLAFGLYGHVLNWAHRGQ